MSSLLAHFGNELDKMCWRSVSIQANFQNVLVTSWLPAHFGNELDEMCWRSVSIHEQSKIALSWRMRLIDKPFWNLNRKSPAECHCDSFAIQNRTAKSHSDDDFESFPTHKQSNVAWWDRCRFMPNPKSHAKTGCPCQNIEKSEIALTNPAILTISPVMRPMSIPDQS